MITKNEILEKLESIILESFNYVELEKVTGDNNLYTDLELDSLDAVDFSVAVYGAFEVKLTPEDFQQIQTVADLVDLIAIRLKDTDTAN